MDTSRSATSQSLKQVTSRDFLELETSGSASSQSMKLMNQVDRRLLKGSVSGVMWLWFGCDCDVAMMWLWFGCDVAVVRLWSELEISGSAISFRLWSGCDTALMGLIRLWFWNKQVGDFSELDTHGSAKSQSLKQMDRRILRPWNKLIGNIPETEIRLWCGWFGCDSETNRSAISQSLTHMVLQNLRAWNKWIGEFSGLETSWSAIFQRLRFGCDVTDSAMILKQTGRRFLRAWHTWFCKISELETNGSANSQALKQIDRQYPRDWDSAPVMWLWFRRWFGCDSGGIRVWCGYLWFDFDSAAILK